MPSEKKQPQPTVEELHLRQLQEHAHDLVKALEKGEEDVACSCCITILQGLYKRLDRKHAILVGRVSNILDLGV